MITGRYIITLNSVFGQTIKVRYSSYLLIMLMCSWAGTNSGMDYWNGTDMILHSSNSYKLSKLGTNDFPALANARQSHNYSHLQYK